MARAEVTLKNRLAIAKDEFEVGPTCHITNGDEENVPRFAGQYHKTLPHDKFGQVRASTSTSMCTSMQVWVRVCTRTRLDMMYG